MFFSRIGVAVAMLVVAACASDDGPTTRPADIDESETNEPLPAVTWSYDDTEAWGRLSSDFAVCDTGRSQSPIDLTDPLATDDSDVRFDYDDATVTVVDNTHTIEAELSSASAITVDGQTYQLIELHFHAHSEHAVDGQFLPMEMHLVHVDGDGRIAVVGMMIVEGRHNPAFDPIWNNLPPAGEQVQASEPFSLDAVVPGRRDLLRYSGSLTTPPCIEGVEWLVMVEPIEMSTEQIATFTTRYPANHRPLQPPHGRVLATTTS